MPKEINNAYINLIEDWASQPQHKKAGYWPIIRRGTLGENWQINLRAALGKSPFYKITPGTPFIGIHSGVAYLHPEPEEKIGHKVPMSQMIDKLQKENKQLSKELDLKEAQIKKLKQILREAYKPRILKKISIHGSIVSLTSLFVSLIYSFNIIHPILAGPMLIISLLLLLMSISLGKSKKAIA